MMGPSAPLLLTNAVCDEQTIKTLQAPSRVSELRQYNPSVNAGDQGNQVQYLLSHLVFVNTSSAVKTSARIKTWILLDA